MKILRPTWLTHSGERKDHEIYSCHVSPDGSRLVTAAGDGLVRVWSTNAIYNYEKDPSRPRQLASMSYHTGTIHTVRFSKNGLYLASGADDKLVVIYRLDPNAKAQKETFGSNEAPPVESWRVYRRLIGHENDVQDLGWSHDSSIMVSVGLDSKVVVWSGYTFEKLKTLAGHQSHVKGITFDPANKYFATASDDRTIKIWRFNPPGPNSGPHDQMNNFMLEKTVTAPFISSPLTTYFRRCSWGPDGQHIAAPNATNGPMSTVAIINRGTWDGEINLLGGEGPSEVSAFAPRLFGDIDQSQPENQDKQARPHTVIACGGQDKALSVWVTPLAIPVAIVHDIVGKPISDLAWTPDGGTLFIASLDGTMMVVRFDFGELGFEMPDEDIDQALAKFGAGRRGAGIIEGPESLLLEEQSKQGEMRGVEGRMGALMGDQNISKPTAVNANGQVPPVENNVNDSAALTNGDGVTGATAPQMNGQPEKSEDDANAAKLERLKNRITITKEGKKRIAPLLVSSGGGNESSLPRAQLMSTSGNPQAATDQPQTTLDLSKPFDGLPPGGLAALLLGNKRKYAAVEGVEDDHVDKKLAISRKDGAVPIVMNTPNGLLPGKATPTTAGQQPTPDFLRPAVTNPSLAVSQVRLAVPKVRVHIVRSLGKETADDSQQSQSTVFEARNPSQPSATGRPQDQEPCRITVTRRGQPIFVDYLPRCTLLVTGNHDYWIAACEDGSIYGWTPSGRRFFNAFVLEAQPVILECHNQYVLCITAVGMCYVWDILILSSPHPPVSLGPVLDLAIHSLTDHVTKAPAITSGRVNSEGRIIVTLTNGEGYAYNSSMYVWQRLSELWWLVGSQYWNTTDSSVGNLQSNNALGSSTDKASNTSSGVIAYLERSTTHATLARGRARMLQQLVKQLLSREGFEGFESTISIAHLENRIAGAMMLGARDDFQIYLYMYAKRIGAEGLKSKVEELLRGLEGSWLDDEGEEGEGEAGPVNGNTEANQAVKPHKRPQGSDRYWGNPGEQLCGWSRQDLLKDIILILGKNRDLQRTTVPYAKLLGITDGGAEPENASIEAGDAMAL